MSENEMETAAASARGDGSDQFVWVNPENDEEIRLVKPTPAQHMVLLGIQGGFSSAADQMATFINFFYALVSEQDKQKIRRWLLDPTNEFDDQTITDILTEATEHWSGRPTEPSSSSTDSPKSTGRKSTPGGRRSTRSTSESTDS